MLHVHQPGQQPGEMHQDVETVRAVRRRMHLDSPMAKYAIVSAACVTEVDGTDVDLIDCSSVFVLSKKLSFTGRRSWGCGS